MPVDPLEIGSEGAKSGAATPLTPHMGQESHRRIERRGLGVVLAARRDFRNGRRAPVDVGVIGAARNDGDPLFALGDRQHGVGQTRQLTALGISPSAISRKRRAGLLHRVHRGVYAIGRGNLTPEGRWTAATLATHPPSLLTHRNGLELWGALPASDALPHVLAHESRRVAGIDVHRCAALHPDDSCALDLIPVTAPARSLLDFAAGGDLAELERALNELRIARLVRPRDFDELRARTRGHHGWGPLGRLLAAELEPGFSREEAELRMLALIRAAALPSPHRNARIGRWEVDFFWEAQRLVVEIDGYAVHSGRTAFERDRRKQAELQDLGLEVLRFTWWQITEQQLWVIARLASRLGARAPAA